jgi:tetratricopeptide (TPR) repeat protein
MLGKLCLRAVGLIVLLWLGACAPGQKILPSLISEGTAPFEYELRGVPFFPQEKYQCGPASMASLLKSSGVEVTPDDLVAKIFLPERKGSLQVELLAVARRYGRIPYVIEQDLTALLEEILAGRPVLVLQNLAFKRWPVWHYAVVVGFDRSGDALILHSGSQARKRMPARKYLTTWSKASFWGLVLLKPGELPARPDHDLYVETLAQIPLESFSDLLIPGYQAAVAHWPDSEVAFLGLGNAWFAAGHPEQAAEAFNQFLLKNPDHHIIRNNLAEVLASLGKYEEALKEIEKTLEGADESNPFYPAFLQTRRNILKQMVRP